MASIQLIIAFSAFLTLIPAKSHLLKNDLPDGTQYTLSANINMSDVIEKYRGNMFALLDLTTISSQLSLQDTDPSFQSPLAKFTTRVWGLLKSIDNARYGFKDTLDIEHVNINSLKVILLMDGFKNLDNNLTSFGQDMSNGNFDGLAIDTPKAFADALVTAQTAQNVHISSVANFVNIMKTFITDITYDYSNSFLGFGNQINFDGFSCFGNPFIGSYNDAYKRLNDDANDIINTMNALNDANGVYANGLAALVEKVNSNSA